MAYDVTEERLKVKGSEQITRDLKVNRDAFINGTTDTKNLTVEDDATVKGEAIFEDDVAIHGDLYVEGTTTTTSEAQVSSSGNYIVTRDNNATPLATGEYSGLAVNNYATGKIATITADKDGTWRISDSATATATTYTNISAYNGVYYTGLSQTTTTGPSGILTNVDADELASVVLNGSSYYHKAGNDWFGPVTLVSNALDMGSIVTDATLITTLNGLTKNDLVYYRSVIDKTIDASTNQPLLTRAESSSLTGGQALTWDATNEKAVGKTIDTTVTANSSNLITSGAVKTAIDNEATARDNAISSAIATEVTNRNTAITNAVNALDVASTGGDGKYISAISETNGKISATATTMDTTPTANSTKAVTSGGVKTAINTAETNAKNLANATGTLAIAHGGTGATTANDAANTLLAGLPDWTADPSDDVKLIRRDTTGSATFGQVKFSTVWNYIKDKISSVLGLSTTGLSTGTITTTGDIHVGKGKSIIADGTKANYAMIKFKDNTADNYGNGVVIGGGGAVVIGGGESADTYYSGAGLTASSETMAVTNDGAIDFVSNLNGGYANRKTMTMGTDGKLTNSQGFVGPLTGNASTADTTRGTAYCTTAAGTAAKVASMRGYVLQSGATFPITFNASNTAASALTLAVNGTTAKPIYINGAASSSSNYTLPAGTYLCTYDGTNYLISTNSINISTKMNMTNPAGTGSFSLNRLAGSTVGTNSFAEGYNTTASGNKSHAEGDNTIASGNFSHAEGNHTIASEPGSHAEGSYSKANGMFSHVEGFNTIASGDYQHVQGKWNVESENIDWAFVIGGGSSSSARKNILAFDWNGNLHIFGDIYVHCNTDGTGGTKK